MNRGEATRPLFRVYQGGQTDTSQPASRPRCGPVTVVQVVPAVWRRALGLAAGDTSRLQILGPGSVVVHNSGSWR